MSCSRRIWEITAAPTPLGWASSRERHCCLRSGTIAGHAWTELQTIAGFYNLLNGSAYAFSYPDDTDNAVTSQLFGIADGVSASYQLVRTFGGFSEPVYLPTGTPLIYDNGTLKTVTTDYTISATGVVTFTYTPTVTHPLTWTGTFNWLVRFDTDSIDFEEIYSQFWRAKSVTFSNEILP